ncbi:U3 small nucleolar RNA-associated protein 8 [Scheffersomyces coipomensis]|uniref:U3 small nucleolar RNA-associated protein 8 n=1 Tax=Scheffersomyces coipomensis TaxID=1788519 RepID=UPI00315C9B31
MTSLIPSSMSSSSSSSNASSLSHPSLTDHYPVTILPRISDLTLSNRVSIPTLSSSINESNIIDFGISKSIISSYIIKPTPKLIWSYALSPSCVVDCMDVYQIDNIKYYLIGITDRKLHKIVVIKRGIIDNETKAFEVKVTTKIINIKSIEQGKSLMVIYEQGTIEKFNLDIDDEGDIVIESSKLELTTSIKRKSTIIFNQFINDLLSDKSLILLISHHQSSLQYTLVSYSSTQILEINSFITPSTTSALKFSYVNGFIYNLNLESLTISSINIGNFKLEKSISINSLISTPSKDVDNIAFFSPSIDRLIISINNKIHLINFKFESLLDTFISKSSSSSETNPDKVFINQVLNVKGQSLNTVNSIIVYSYLKNKDKNVYLSVINLNVGLNKLNECLGKSLKNVKQVQEQEQENEQFTGLINLINDNFDIESNQLSQELSEIYHQLKTFSGEKNLSQWERVLIPYLKNESWESIKKSINKPHKKGKSSNVIPNGTTNLSNGSKIYNFKEFDVENDRIIDINFIRQILLLIFKFDTNHKIEYKQSDFIPEYTLIYLLTNPLFPDEFTKGLLQLFNKSSQITLLRQSIITCPNLTVIELLEQLINGDNNKDIFQDLINRLIAGFSTIEITKKFKYLIESHINEDFKLDQLLNKLLLVEKNYKIWYLIEIIIDVGGLFNWSESTIEKLQQLIEIKINSLMANSYNLTLVNQVLLSPTSHTKKQHIKSKGNKKSKEGDIISTNVQQQAQLDSILTIANIANNKHLDNPSIEISKKVPNYSIDKLIL